MNDSINAISDDNYIEIININFQIKYFKLFMQFVFNYLNIFFIKINKKNVVHINNNNDDVICEY